MTTGSLILQFHLNTILGDMANKLRYEEKVRALLEYNKKEKGSGFLVPLNIYLDILENTDEVMLAFMNEPKKAQLLRDLQVTYLLLLTQKKYELEHQKTENARSYDRDIKKCQRLIDMLNYEKVCDDNQTQAAPEYSYATDGKTVAYLSIFFGQKFAEEMVECMDRKTKTIIENMGWVNERRLYWVWASSLLKTTLELLPTDFFNTNQAKQTARTPDMFTGCMSWSLYYFRFFLNLGLLLKHTISGPWMSAEEQSTPWTERFTTQWNQRKFSLLNDSVWATGNLVCFFWLYGKGVAGTWGDMLTIGLLIFDIVLAVWDFEEQQTRYNKELLDYDTNIHRLKMQINALQDDRDDNAPKNRAELNLRLVALTRARADCQRQWSYQKIILATNISYAVGLMLAFVLLAAPFFPFPAATVMALTVAGAVLCFAFSIISNGIKGGIELHKIKMNAKEIKLDYESKLHEFKLLLKQNPEREDNEKKLLFLEIKKLHARTDYQKQMLTFQTMHLIRCVLFEALIPAIIFASLVFFPFGIGLAAIGAAIALAVCTNLIINASFKPKKEEPGDFSEEEYLTFCETHSKPSIKSLGFFKSDEKTPSSESNRTDYDYDEEDYSGSRAN